MSVAQTISDRAGSFLPGQAAHAVANATAVTGLLPVWTGLVVLFGYVAGMGLLTVVTLSRREVALAA